MPDIQSIIDLLSSFRQPGNALAGQAVQAARRAEPPVYVVPDEQMPRYGEEVPAKSWQQNLGEILGALQVHRATNPVYSPFPAGTPTLAKQQEERLKSYQQEQLGLERQRLALEAAKGYEPSQAELKAEAQGSAENDVWQSIDKLNRLRQTSPEQYRSRYGDYEPVQVVEAQINKQRGQLTASGVDVDRLIDYLYQSVYGMNKQEYLKRQQNQGTDTMER